MEYLDTQRLRAFVALVEGGSFTEAANRLFLTQSAVSHAIKALEEDLECPLVERLGRKIRLLPTGEVLYQRAKMILAEMEKTRVAIGDMASWGPQKIRLGASATACEFLLPAVLREFRESFPKTKISIEQADTPRALELLAEDEIDLALVVTPPPERDVECRLLFVDELRFTVSSQHPWSLRKRVEIKKAISEYFIFYHGGSRTYGLIEQHFRQAGYSLPDHMEMGSMSAIIELLKINLGVGILPAWLIAEEVSTGQLSSLSIVGTKMERPWYLAWKKHHKLTIAEETFLGLTESLAEELALRNLVKRQ